MWICCFGVQALFVVDAKLQQILVFGEPVSVSLARSLLVPSRLNVLGCPTENMFGFLLGQQLPDKLPTILPPTQGNLLAPAVFMCSFVVLADLYVLGVVPAAGPFLVCAFVFVFEVSLGEHRSCARSFPLGLRFLSDGAVLQGRSSCPCTSTPRATGSRWPTVSFSTLAGMRAAPLRSALRRSEVTVWSRLRGDALPQPLAAGRYPAGAAALLRAAAVRRGLRQRLRRELRRPRRQPERRAERTHRLLRMKMPHEVEVLCPHRHGLRSPRPQRLG